MISNSRLPSWTTHVISFVTPHSDGRDMAAYLQSCGRALGGARIMDLGDGRAALDDAAVAELRGEPEDADGCIDAEMRCWISGMAWDVEPAESFTDGSWRIGTYA